MEDDEILRQNTFYEQADGTLLHQNEIKISLKSDDVSNMNDLDRLKEATWSPTVGVLINVNYTKLLDIDTINQRFQAEAIIESKWIDPGINSYKHKIDESSIWKPDLYIENGIKDIKEEVTYQIVPFSTEELPKFMMKSIRENVNNKIFMMCEMRKVI